MKLAKLAKAGAVVALSAVFSLLVARAQIIVPATSKCSTGAKVQSCHRWIFPKQQTLLVLTN